MILRTIIFTIPTKIKKTTTVFIVTVRGGGEYIHISCKKCHFVFKLVGTHPSVH